MWSSQSTEAGGGRDTLILRGYFLCRPEYSRPRYTTTTEYGVTYEDIPDSIDPVTISATSGVTCVCTTMDIYGRVQLLASLRWYSSRSQAACE